MNKKVKVTCMCGHTKAKHKGVWDIFDRFYPGACQARMPQDHSSCICWDYKADNLLYLEKLSEQE